MKKLSFCIPTYNRSAQCLKLVKEILSVKNENIEVIVSDNCSTDNTVFLLNQINDDRLFIYQNEKNKGSLFNIYNSFSKARGEYIYFTTDKDFINIQNMNSFLLFLTQNDILACGYCEYQSQTKNEIFTQGFDAINRLGYMGHHPSGYFFNRAKLDSINYQEKFSDKEFVGEFYLDFILAELALEGDVGVFNESLTIPQDNSEAANDKSLSIKGTHTNAYYTPDSRLKLTINQTKHLNSLRLSINHKKEIILKLFFKGLANSTIEYRNILQNQNICEHYNLMPKKINLFELLFIGFNFYVKYIRNVKDFGIQDNLNILTFNFHILKIFFNKIKNRAKCAK